MSTKNWGKRDVLGAHEMLLWTASTKHSHLSPESLPLTVPSSNLSLHLGLEVRYIYSCIFDQKHFIGMTWFNFFQSVSVQKPTPLYVNPKITSPQMRYKSSLLEAAVERSRETWAKLLDRIPPVTSNVESTPFLCTPRTKLLKQSRYLLFLGLHILPPLLLSISSTSYQCKNQN